MRDFLPVVIKFLLLRKWLMMTKPLSILFLLRMRHKCRSPINAQAQAATTLSHVMTSQDNYEVVPKSHQQVTTMASRLRDFTPMNPPTFFGDTVEKEPREFIDEIYKILFTMGLYTIRRA